MLSLEEILVRLNDAPGLDAFLVSEAALPVDVDAADERGRTPIVFIPDLHILSHERSEGYGDFFNLNHDAECRLLATLQRLIDLRDHRSDWAGLRVFQLGDFHDLWREAEHWWWDEDVREMVDRQLRSHRPLFELFGLLETERLVGNHDKKLRTEKDRLAGQPIDAYFPGGRIHPNAASFRWGAFHRIDMIHADIFDKTETGSFHFLNPVGSRLAEHDGLIPLGNVDEWAHELDPPGVPDAPGPSGPIEPAFLFAEGDERSRYFRNAREFFRQPENAGPFAAYPPAATIIGHTHFPRIVLEGSGPGYSLVDCGSWVNQSLKPKTSSGFWNGQIGFLTGDRVRIFQIGRNL